jgi:Domain of unknown function (DUF397)
MNPSEGFAGAVWSKSMRSDRNGGQCVEVTSLEGRRGRAVGFSRPQGRRGDSKNPNGGTLIFSPDEWKIFLSRVRTPASPLVRRVGVSPTRRLVCDAITQ